MHDHRAHQFSSAIHMTVVYVIILLTNYDQVDQDNISDALISVIFCNKILKHGNVCECNNANFL